MHDPSEIEMHHFNASLPYNIESVCINRCENAEK